MADEDSAAPNWIEDIDIRHIATPAAKPPEVGNTPGCPIKAAPSVPVSIFLMSMWPPILARF
ncbi:hypothetical protein CUJ84_Chr005056 [Rhizobium leguminosarum]|uniref:Uncharacterized protein n=1 Tax=Rhizobium leguminosarum TaxID=384 RepID=A0A2K9ZAQ5_RHILE|nr:hypothetical protein CUJ84_Chr005056 [Rhizobium leguminosarum]